MISNTFPNSIKSRSSRQAHSLPAPATTRGAKALTGQSHWCYPSPWSLHHRCSWSCTPCCTTCGEKRPGLLSVELCVKLGHFTSTCTKVLGFLSVQLRAKWDHFTSTSSILTRLWWRSLQASHVSEANPPVRSMLLLLWWFCGGFLIPNCIVPLGYLPMGNSHCFPWGKPAVTESLNSGACWVFQCFHNPQKSDTDYRIFNVDTDVSACDWMGSSWRDFLLL